MNKNPYRKYKVTKTNYELVDGKWVKMNQTETYEKQDHVDTLLSDCPQPFEKSHRRYKQKAGAHRFDTYETIDPSGTYKWVAFVDFKDYKD